MTAPPRPHHALLLSAVFLLLACSPLLATASHRTDPCETDGVEWTVLPDPLTLNGTVGQGPTVGGVGDTVGPRAVAEDGEPGNEGGGGDGNETGQGKTRDAPAWIRTTSEPQAIVVAWASPCAADAFRVHRAEEGSPDWLLIAQVPGDYFGSLRDHVEGGMRYCYTVTVVHDGIPGLPSDPACETAG